MPVSIEGLKPYRTAVYDNRRWARFTPRAADIFVCTPPKCGTTWTQTIVNSLIFQDGDKRLYGPMLDRLVDLLRPGGLLLTDNVLWDGEVVPGYVPSPRRNADDTRAIADYNERLNAHPRLMTSIVPLRDGVAISVKRRP